RHGKHYSRVCPARQASTCCGRGRMKSGSEAGASTVRARQRGRIIRREEIPTLRTAIVDGVQHNLGILKDFRAHPDLCSFLPEDARLAMSWVRLEPEERLDVHVHPIESMIVVAHGAGRTLGDLESPFSDGDIILIPRGCAHGFVGAGDWGFWALSAQFEARGLYEDPSHALGRCVGGT